ncbi:membrane protein [Pullulanibacillus camelliae]|uniref:Membrane protein n=1 Tax=Pullulanibacillus camelliae TaxID=1707096 RepID=A0A8J2YKJ0_9BACL|nr:AEC family transporter [Pullulanibacillus camelliae]GGE48773.1 membrane protein [Pullulanibacillus camelliae]
MVFFNIVLPVFIVFGFGYLIQKLFHLQLLSISTTVMYILTPCLAFKTFSEAELDLSTLYILIFALSLMGLQLALLYLYIKIRRLTIKDYCGMVLSVVFMNSGNYGVPVALFAFGKAGMHPAVFLMVIQSLLMSTVGLYFAAKGGERDTHISPLRRVLKVPIAYGAVIGALFSLWHFSLPEALQRPVDLISDATVPMVMLLLGMQLANISFKKIEVEKVSAAVIGRLVVSPLIALFLIWLLPVSGIVEKVLLLTAAMPTAANTTMFAMQFNAKTNLVTTTTLLTTLLSILSTPLWIHLLI